MNRDFRLTDLDAEDVINPVDMSLTDPLQSYTEAWTERLEYELYGAWRAGYDYVHIYTDPTPASDRFNEPVDDSDLTFTETRYVHPSHVKRPACPDTPRYLYTYDLKSVPDHVLMAAWRGELDSYERINADG